MTGSAPLSQDMMLPHIGTDEFRNVMRTLACSVCIITSRSADGLAAMTATAVCSVSADPPSVLVVVNRSNRTHPVIEAAGAFAIHFLRADQKHLAAHFASRPADLFAGITFSDGVLGSPILDECGTVLECRVASASQAGTHSIFVADVVRTRSTGGPPLIYHDAGVCTLASSPASK